MKLFLPDTTKNKELTTWNMDLLNPTLHGGGHYGPPINFEASQLKQEGLFWFNLHTNLVTWVPTMAKTQNFFLNVNSV